MINVLVLFTCYNRRKTTQKCIESLMKNKNVTLDFIVVDDNSTDGTKEMLQQYSNITVLDGNGNLYYSGGMRKNIAYAKGSDLTRYEYVLFINDDVLFFENSIDKLVEYEDNSNCIIAGAVSDSNGAFSYGGERKKSKFRPGSYENVAITDSNLRCDTTCANCVLIPTNIFIKLPNIDKAYSHSMGDFDYFLEAVRRGYTILSSDFYVGQCNDNPIAGGWRDTSLPRLTRMKKKESAKGLPFKEHFYYIMKNHGILKAIIFSMTPYIRIFIGK